MLPQQQLFHRAWRTPHGPTQHASEFEQQWGFCVDGRDTMRRTGSPLQGEDLSDRREVGRGASSKSVMLARHVPNDFDDFLPLRTI